MVQELNFQAYSDRLPPQNIDAEEAILGGILLDPEAINRVADLLRPEVFYLSAHQEIYRAMLALQAQGSPTDLMSVASWLQDRSLLAKVGGQSKLAQLVERTVSSVNIDQYAHLVVDKHLRRKLIQTGNEIAHLAHDTAVELERVLDQSEQKIFGITQDRPQNGLISTADVLTHTFSDIESRSLGMVLPGLSCGFYDLDAMTQGFQRSDLVIVAGRPSMGKCLAYDAEILLADGRVTTIEAIYKSQQASLLTLGDDWRFRVTQPTAFVDDGIKPVFRVTTRLGRSIETTLTHPYLTPQGWRQLSTLKPGARIAVPRRLAIFGDKTLPQEELQQLGQQIGQICVASPSDTAAIASIPSIVFQLQRPQLALFLHHVFRAACGTRIDNQHPFSCTPPHEPLARQLQHLLLRFGVIAGLQSHLVPGQPGQRIWQLTISDARSLQTFATEIGRGEPASLAPALASVESKPARQTVLSAVASRKSRVTSETLVMGQTTATSRATRASAPVLEGESLDSLVTHDLYWDEIVAIQFMGKKQVYDLTIPETHNFVANDICVHNTSFTLNIARNIAAFHKLPVAVFSLEMSKEQLVQRLLASEVRIESGRLRAGRIHQNEWETLGHAISTLSQLSVFIDDTPNISVMEMRSKARRLQAEQGGALGLVLIDYLQLMEGGGDNRVQELSKVTRALKGMARELNVPVIALSQLSRGVESRTNKRPMMSDLRECVTGDTLVWLADGRRVPIADLVGQTPEVISMDAQGRLIKAKTDLIWEVGKKPIYELTTASGRKIRATGKHRLYTFDGWQQLQSLKVGDRLAVASHMPIMGEPVPRWPESHLILLAHLIGDGSYIPHQPLRYTTASEENSAAVREAAEAFGCTVNRHPGKGNWHQLVLSGNGNRWHPAGIGLWLRQLEIFGQRSADKHIPTEVFQLPTDQVALFLRHLWATDGCISSYHHPNSQKYKASIFFSTVSERLARDVVALLLRLGIASTLKWTKSQCYSVQIYGKTHQLKFLEVVGAFGPRVQPAEAVKRELLNRGKANPNRDTIPIEVFNLVKREMRNQGISHRQMAAARGTSYGGSAHFQFAPTKDLLLSYAEILDSILLKEIATSDLFWDEITSIEPVGEATVYDLTVPGPASWMADGIVSHNSGSIEQDADLVMMLYRDEYYNEDTPDRGIAEVIVCKHRNGPTGTVKLLFESQFTQFRNLASPNRPG